MAGSRLKRARREGRISADIVLDHASRAPAPARSTPVVPYIDWSNIGEAKRTILKRLDYMAVAAHREGQYMAAIAAERTLLERIGEIFGRDDTTVERTPEEWLAYLDSLKAEVLERMNTVEVKADDSPDGKR